jgi:V/A-type H+-transporting ATPase subunit C
MWLQKLEHVIPTSLRGGIFTLMSDFDYGNARLRAMRSFLLSPPALAGLAGAGSVPGLVSALSRTAYREPVEAALVQFAGIGVITQALRQDFISVAGKVRHFFTGVAAELAAWVLRRYDLDNVKTLLRGLGQQAPANEIVENILPVGDLRPADMAALAQAANPRGAIDLLATWRLPLAQPLLALQAERPGADLSEMEVALERWYFQSVMAVTQEQGEALRETVLLNTDVTNILTALRLVGVPDLAALLRQHFQAESARPLFIGPGRIPLVLLEEMASQASVPQAVDKVAGTSYGPLLVEALPPYQVTGRLSEFERTLTGHQLAHATNLFVRDAHGIGVLIGYLALKRAEIARVRHIAYGLQLGEDADVIRAELF